MSLYSKFKHQNVDISELEGRIASRIFQDLQHGILEPRKETALAEAIGEMFSTLGLELSTLGLEHVGLLYEISGHEHDASYRYAKALEMTIQEMGRHGSHTFELEKKHARVMVHTPLNMKCKDTNGDLEIPSSWAFMDRLS